MAFSNIQELNHLKAVLAVLPVFLDPSISFVDTPPNLLKEGVPTTIHKTREMIWLRSKFPELTTEELKNDDSLVKHLTKKWNRHLAFQDELSDTQETEIEEALAAQETATNQAVQAEQAGAMQSQEEAIARQSSGVPVGGLPSVPSLTSPAGRVVYRPPQPPQPPKPDIAIANKSGAVIEKPDPGAQLVNPQGQAISSASGGRVVREPIQSKLVTSKGQPLRYSQGFGSRVKDIGSTAQRFARENGGKVLGGLRNMAGNAAGGAVRGGGNMLASGLNGNFPGKRVFSNGIGRVRGVAGRGQSQLAKVGKSRLKWVILGMLLFGGIFGLVTSSNPTGQPVSTSQLIGGNIGIGSTAPIPPGLTSIIVAAAQITPILYQLNPQAKCLKGQPDYTQCLETLLFHNKRDEPNKYYWCTDIVIDAYNKAGFNGLSRTAHEAVLSMKAFFANTQGYRLLPATTPVEQLRPGDVIFFEGSGSQHTALVKTIDISPNTGNGAIKTAESNNVTTEDTVNVQGHIATKAQTTANTYSITGFGQAI